MGLNPQFWESRKVLVTGHTGFKGSWLCLWLEKLRASVVGYSLAPPTEPNLFDLARVASGMTSIGGDVRDLSHLTGVFRDQRPEIVIHLAAQSLVRESYRDPVGTYQTNVMGTVHVLEAARRCESVKAVVIVTSDKCYENREWVWPYRENEPLGGHDPYSSSKACAELVAAAFRSSFFGRGNGPRPLVATVRAGNVIGGGDWAQDRLIPDCIRAFVAGRSVELRYPQSVRPWQHVLDPLCGYMTLCERLVGHDGRDFSDAWNFGPEPGDDTTASDVAQRAAQLWGATAPLHTPSANGPDEARILRLDTSKAAHRLGFRRRWGLDRAVAETVAWYKAWDSGGNMHEFSCGQIAAYETGEVS